jgi:hypothetical protein
MSALLISKVDALGSRIKALVDQLYREDYVFEYPDEVFPGPSPDAADAISRIEQEAGEVPMALKLFWLRVGSVNLCGAHATWLGCDYPDPLVVSPPAHALPDLEDYLEEPEDPFLIPIAPDFFHKANVSGGMYYNVSAPSDSDDPLLNDERHGVSLLDYLAIALGWGGFPGLEDAAGHTWPLARLQSAAGALR